VQDAAIVTFGLAKSYPSSGRGVRAISLTVRPGEICGLVGPIGSGKSTVIKVLATRLRAEYGSFMIGGTRVPSYRWSEQALLEVRRQIGVLLEDAPHCGDLTGGQNMQLHARLHRVPAAEARQRTGRLLEELGLHPMADRPVRLWGYSGRRRLALAQALLHRPPVLLLDEPELGQTAEARGAVQAAIRQAAGAGATVLVATADPNLAAALCDSALLLQEGRIAVAGPAREVLTGTGTGALISIRLDLPAAVPDLAVVPGLLGASAGDYGLAVRVADPEAALPALIGACMKAGLRLAGLEVRRDSLQSVARRRTEV
jgi:ABC-type multidrug transport system ATPase subunit